MNALTTKFVTICFATLASAVCGWVAPPARRRSMNLDELCVLAGGLGLGFVMNPDPLIWLLLGTLFPRVYYAFKATKTENGSLKKALWNAFAGAVMLFIYTPPSWTRLAIGLVVGFGGPPAAYWLTQRTQRAVGLALVVAATAFQLSRVPFLLDSGAGARMSAPVPLPYLTTAHD
jgi:hypothetical protein